MCSIGALRSLYIYAYAEAIYFLNEILNLKQFITIWYKIYLFDLNEMVLLYMGYISIKTNIINDVKSFNNSYATVILTDCSRQLHVIVIAFSCGPIFMKTIQHG